MKKRILVAPLNWGIGHATRCIPIINWLREHDFEPIIASDGDALQLLKTEFPNLIHEVLPAYNIKYTKKGSDLKWKLLAQTPKMLKTKKAEKKITKLLIDKYNICGIISDNRLGVRNKNVPSVFITHQLNVLSGNTSTVSTKIHSEIMKKFDSVWVPDFKNEPSLSGKLGHLDNDTKINTTYLGPLSRLNKTEAKIEYDIMVLLSGPEPQRTILADKLFETLKSFEGNILFVKGKIEAEQTVSKINNFTIYNFMTSKAIEQGINSSKLIISRSGYTTIMDLAKLGKKAFFIATPGQFEQEYLAENFDNLGIVPTCNQEHFELRMLEKVNDYEGLQMEYSKPDLKELFSLF